MSDNNSISMDATSGSTFPVKLHKLLESIDQESSHSEVISWLPGGKAFKVHQKEEFVKVFLPAFSNASKFKSFQRNLNLWDFNTVSKGPDKGVCSHPHFIRGKPDLVKLMKRISVKGTRVRRPSQQSSFPVKTASTGSTLTDGEVSTTNTPSVSAEVRIPSSEVARHSTLPDVKAALAAAFSTVTSPPSALVSEDLVWHAALSQAAKEVYSARLLNQLAMTANHQQPFWGGGPQIRTQLPNVATSSKDILTASNPEANAALQMNLLSLIAAARAGN